MSRSSTPTWRIWSLLALMLAFLGWGQRGVAQVVPLLQNQRVEILDGNSRRGELTYDVYVLDADRVEENTFDFRGARRASIRVDIRITARKDKWDERMRVGFARRAFAQHDPQFWKIVDERELILGSKDPVERLIFETRREGTSNLFIPFNFLDVTDADWHDSKTWSPYMSVKNRIAVPRITVRGLYSEQQEEWSVATATTKVLIETIQATDADPKLVAEGKLELEKRVKQDAREYIYKSGSDRTTMLQFIALYEPYIGRGLTVVDDHVTMTRRYLKNYLDPEPSSDNPTATPTADRSISPALGAIRQALGSRDTSEARRVIEAYENQFPDQIAELQDSLLCWTPASYRVLDRKGTREQVKLINFHTPAYYDVFHGHLEINDSALVNHRVLDVALLRHDPISIEIRDKACPEKRVVIALDNLMSAEIVADSVSGIYRITFQGGKMPYGVQLVATDGSERSWSRRGIHGTELILTRDSLQAAGLSGSWRAEAFSTGSDKPVPVAGRSIVIPDRPRPVWLLPVLTVLAVGVLALLLLYIIRRGGTRHRTIFDET